MIFDLHTHSSASDGALHPNALLRHARDCGVDVTAITDHDTLDAYNLINDDATGGIRLIAGIELSTSWSRCNLHVVGLNVDPADATLRAGVCRQQAGRRQRAKLIAARLQKLGIPDPLPQVLDIAAGSVVGRPHFAEHLVRSGFVRDVRTAFRKYLGPGKIGDVKHGWADLPETIAWIRAAGGTAVLAHPARYGFTMTKLGALAREFRDAGGVAIEVVCGRQDPNVTTKLSRLCEELGLAASCGSDFHNPGLSWSRPGGFSPLPESLGKVWELW